MTSPPSDHGGGGIGGDGSGGGSGGGGHGGGGHAVSCAESARLLLEAGAPVHAKDFRGRTPLDYCNDPVLAAARGEAATTLLQALLEAPSPPRRPNKRRNDVQAAPAAASAEDKPPGPRPQPRVEFAEPVHTHPTAPLPPPTDPPPRGGDVVGMAVGDVQPSSPLHMADDGEKGD